MRALILIAGAALGLSACGNNDQKDNNLNVDENLTAESIVSNDVTAIDAATGDAANMAADVDMNYGNLLENGTSATSNTPAKPGASAPRHKPEPAAENGTANTVVTNAE